MLGLVPFSAQYLFQRAFYAFADARTPFLIQVPVVLTIAATSFASGHLLDPQHIVVGVGLGMAARVPRWAPCCRPWSLHRTLGRTRRPAGAAHVRAARRGRRPGGARRAPRGLGRPRTGWARPRPRRPSVLVVGGLAVLVAYLGACRLLRVTEIGELAEPVLKRLPGRRATRE